MFSYLVRTLIVAVAGSTFLVGAIACTQQAARKSKDVADSGDLFEDDEAAFEYEDPFPSTPIGVGKGDAGAIELPTRPNDGGVKDGGRIVDDASSTPCNAGVQNGDLRIVEIMVSSKSGSGDQGEWVEIQSTRVCELNVKGVTITSPRGTIGSDSVTISRDIVLPKYGTFIVAASDDVLKNGGLPGPVVAWGATDVLKNDGDTIEISANGISIDKLTYPNLQLTPGVSVSFPADCSWIDRANWQRWSKSAATYGASGLYGGTPNGDNIDVVCGSSP